MSPSPGSRGQTKSRYPLFFGLAGPFFDEHVNILEKAVALMAVMMGLIVGCTSIPVEERASRRAEIDRTAEETIAILSEKDVEFSAALEDAAGYFAGTASTTTVAVIGGAYGIGVLVDLSTGERTYLNIKRLDLGRGPGYTKIPGRDVGQRQGRTGRPGGVGALTVMFRRMRAAGKSASSSALPAEGQKAYIVSDSGATLSATARLAKLSVNQDLTDTGLSEFSIPNIGMGIEDGRESAEHRTWDHKLPFMAQKVIDLGYDLPLPYGLKVLYSDIEQDQILEDLQVGFSGGEKEPFEWVAFENAISLSETWQAIGDAWVLPFLNVFAFIGDVKGDVTLDVFLEGNGLLEQKGIDCTRPGNLAICRALQDRIIELPVESVFSGTNYGVGFNLAGGWKGFFFTLPVSFSWVDMDTTDVEGGAIISASPRAGYLFKMGNYGNLGALRWRQLPG